MPLACLSALMPITGSRRWRSYRSYTVLRPHSSMCRHMQRQKVASDRRPSKFSPDTWKPGLIPTQVHVIAAGGIYDGRGLASALMYGAQGVWVGTRFVASTEAGAPKKHKDL